jgi:hypothetical protein
MQLGEICRWSKLAHLVFFVLDRTFVSICRLMAFFWAHLLFWRSLKITSSYQTRVCDSHNRFERLYARYFALEGNAPFLNCLNASHMQCKLIDVGTRWVAFFHFEPALSHEFVEFTRLFLSDEFIFFYYPGYEGIDCLSVVIVCCPR